MTFSSFDFFLFLPITLVLYYALRHQLRAQNTMLLVASYIFYGAWDWRFLSLIIGSTIVDFICGARIANRPGQKGRWLALSCCSNLGLLFVFKYFNFFQNSFCDLMGVCGLTVNPYLVEIILPVGISFYTFQTMSYSIDIYRGKLKPTNNLLDFALFVAYFPQLVAGPVERAVRLLPQISAPRVIDWYQIRCGAWLIVWGYYKKVFVADNISGIVDTAFAAEGTTGGAMALVGVYTFAIQIYCDFSGYTDIARGCSKLMGIELMRNFNHPYFARSPSDYWERWHISMSSWLRDYLYISLGGNRGGTFMLYRNLWLTMVLGGLWHGANWNYVLWGVFHGFLLIGYRLVVGHPKRKAPDAESLEFSWQRCLRASFEVFIMFQFTCFGWLLFRGKSVSQIWNMLVAMFDSLTVNDAVMRDIETVAIYAAPLTVIQCMSYAWGASAQLRQSMPRVGAALYPMNWGPLTSGIVVGIVLYQLLVFGTVSQSFIYFQF